jgi:putative copper resistance protein D
MIMKTKRLLHVSLVGAILTLCLSWMVAPLLQASPPQAGQEHMHHQVAPAKPPSQDPLKLEADKRFSEFNHRFAGVFVLLVGLLAILEPRLAQRIGWIRYLWSGLFLLPGLYLLIWSDPESWPTGNQSLHYVITQNHQVLQHKIFSLLLLGLGVVEFIRVRKNLRSVWVSFIFPALAGLGALLLLYHSPQSHAAGMDVSAHLAMEKVGHQHVGFALVGLGIAVSKALADLGHFYPRLMRNLFAVLMIVLAVLLVTYAE